MKERSLVLKKRGKDEKENEAKLKEEQRKPKEMIQSNQHRLCSLL